MTKTMFLTKHIIDAFVEEGNLSERHEYILRTRAKGYTIAMQADELHLSIDQVNKDIATIRRLYDAVQPHSKILPPRKKNKKDLYDSLDL